MGAARRDKVVSALGELEALVDQVVPVSFPPDRLDWPVAARALLSRVASLLRSISLLVQHDQHAEAALVVRSLYEHAVMYCWLAIEPERRMGEWAEHHRAGYLRAIREARTDFEIEPPEHVDLDEWPQRLGDLKSRAAECDAHWGAQIEGLRQPMKGPEGLLTLAGLYTSLYRSLSRIAHADLATVEPVIRPTRSELAVLREHRRGAYDDAVELAVPAAAFPLVVYAHEFGRIDVEAIRRINYAFAGVESPE